MREHYQKQLKKLHIGLLDMGEILEVAIENAVQALKKESEQPLADAKKHEKEINQMENNLENFCLRLIIQQQPVATDLHLISAALKMITDMERIGDHAEDIAILSEHLTAGKNKDIMDNIFLMSEQTSQMLKQSITAYVNEEVSLAKVVWQRDDIVDDLFDKVKKQVINSIKEDSDAAQEAPDLLMIAKYFERIGDHVVNIAEWIIYALTGEHLSADTISELKND